MTKINLWTLYTGNVYGFKDFSKLVAGKLFLVSAKQIYEPNCYLDTKHGQKEMNDKNTENKSL